MFKESQDCSWRHHRYRSYQRFLSGVCEIVGACSTHTTIQVGSANATEAAFGEQMNAELIAYVDLSAGRDQKLLDYLMAVLKAVENETAPATYPALLPAITKLRKPSAAVLQGQRNRPRSRLRHLAATGTAGGQISRGSAVHSGPCNTKEAIAAGCGGDNVC